MTGPLVRDFFKTYRELRYSNSGSIGLSETEKNAYRLSLTLEITHLDAPRYANRKTLPENTHFGYCTLFRGSAVSETIQVKYPKIRVFDVINQGIWNYHQATEAQQLGASVVQLTVEENGRNLLDLLGEGTYGLIRLFVLLGISEGGYDPEEGWLLEAFPPGEEPESYQEFDKAYRGFPVASPFSDVCKFRADVPCSFLFRLEAWYLVNPVVYIVDSPTDASDATDGESEYPEPVPGDGDGDGEEFPEPDPAGTGRDPRDFETGSGQTDWFPGALARIRYTRYPYAANCLPLTEPGEITVGALAPGSYSFSFIGSVNGCDGVSTPGGLRLSVPGGAPVDIAVLEEQQWKLATVDSVVYFSS